MEIHLQNVVGPLADDSTFRVLDTFWSTDIAICTLFGNAFLVFGVAMVTFILNTFYKDVASKSPVLRPFLIICCAFSGVSIGWLIQSFGSVGTQNTGISYFVLSLSSLIGRFTFESVIHNQVVLKGLPYILSFNIIGTFSGFGLACLFIYVFSKSSFKRSEFNIRNTFWVTSHPMKVSMVKDFCAWIVVGAVVPFTGYITILENNSSTGSVLFSPVVVVFMSLLVVFVCLVLTQKFGFYSGNWIYATFLRMLNVFCFKNEEGKQILKNWYFTTPCAILLPIFWGAILGVCYLAQF